MPAWAAILTLCALLGFVLFRNFQHDRRPKAQDSSELIQKEQSAVVETKDAFAELFANSRPAVSIDRDASVMSANDGKAPQHPPVSPAHSPPQKADKPRSRNRSTLGRAGSARPETPPARQLGERLASNAIDDWKSVTRSPASGPASWRRLGITLFLFGKPGGMAAFRHVPIAAAQKKPPVRAGVLRRIPSIDAADLPAAEEMALWETLYGRAGPTARDAPGLREKIERLKLGWFEHVALIQLYQRAGMPAQAEEASAAAHRSADSIRVLLTFELCMRLIGIVLLLGGAAVWLILGARRFGRSVAAGPGTAPAPDAQFFYAPPPTPTGVEAAAAPAVTPARAPFSYRTRMIAFVTYFGSYLFISWPLQLLTPWINSMSEQMALRVEMAIEVSAYVPVTLLTLVVLKRCSEAECRRRLSWGETLASIGLRSDGYAANVVTAVVGYTMIAPVLLLAAFVSDQLFHNFHTPVHPVDLIILSTQDGFVRAMLFIQAAVCAPIVEELAFRGLLFEGLRERWGAALAAALSAAIFALSHNTLPGGFLLLWTLGFVFALVSYRSRSIYPNILMHGIHNGLITVLMFAVFSK